MGAFVQVVLTFLEQAGYGLTATPAPGDLTIGGGLAVVAHGTAVPARGETRVAGHKRRGRTVAHGSRIVTIRNHKLTVTFVLSKRARTRQRASRSARQDASSPTPELRRGS